MNSDGVDRTIVSWRAWYTGGRVFDSETTKWERLPNEGVLLINIYYKTRPHKKTLSSRTLYWKEVTKDGPIYCYDDTADAIISDKARRKNWVKRGKWVTDEEYVETMQTAYKSVIAPNESVRIERARPQR